MSIFFSTIRACAISQLLAIRLVVVAMRLIVATISLTAIFLIVQLLV